MNSKEKIGFVGVGRMGANMARNLKDKGYSISCVNDGTWTQPTPLPKNWDVHASTLAEVSQSDIVLPWSQMMRQWSPSFSIQMIICFKIRQIHFLLIVQPYPPRCMLNLNRRLPKIMLPPLKDAWHQVSQAREGTLYLMIGGKKEVFEKVKDLLDDLSINLRFVGEAGRAAQVKALVNMVMNINTAALAEGLGIGDALGLDLKMLCEIFSQTGANSRVLETDAEDMLERDHECYFSAEHAAKDSGIAIDVAENAGIHVPLAKATLSQYQKMVELGLGELDKSGIAELTFRGRGKTS